ncbi:MAG TPA: lytic transglycosylase domain-containing protein [Gemmatimonadaceae bacterium]|nr:lytic transglycosylase domain-containing protein [Gemmatimonadaceae bacterium]
MRLHSLVSLIVLGLAAPAQAELVFFAGGQTMSVKAHRSEGDRLVLSLRGGGELVCDAALIARIAPDEVPYPEPDSSGIRDLGFGTRAGSNPESRIPSPLVDAAPYGALIDKVAARHGVPARLVRAVIAVESAGQPQARSPKGAMGLMQLMPQTARQYTVANPYDPATNIEAGVQHLRNLLDRFPLAEALAAYNAGEAAVQRFGGIPPFPETERYVSRILRLAGL